MKTASIVIFLTILALTGCEEMSGNSSSLTDAEGLEFGREVFNQDISVTFKGIALTVGAVCVVSYNGRFDEIDGAFVAYKGSDFRLVQSLKNLGYESIKFPADTQCEEEGVGGSLPVVFKGRYERLASALDDFERNGGEYKSISIIAHNRAALLKSMANQMDAILNAAVLYAGDAE